MTLPRALAFYLLGALTAQGCHGKAPTDARRDPAGASMTERRVRTDIAGLANLVNLPDNLVSVRWERTSGKGDSSSLTAILQVQKIDVENILKASRRLDVQSPVTIGVEAARLLLPPGFPIDESDGRVRLKGVNIAPTFFVNDKKSGLVNGKAVLLADDGLIFLSLYEM